MIAAPFLGSLQTAVQVQTGSGQWANGIRLLRKAPSVANGIRPFVRPVVTVAKGAFLAKAALVVGAFAIGYAIGTVIKEPLQRLFERLIDVSQPTDPNATPGWLTEGPLPEDFEVNTSGAFGTEGALVSGSLDFGRSTPDGAGGCMQIQGGTQSGNGPFTVSTTGGQLRYNYGGPGFEGCGIARAGVQVLVSKPSSGKESDAVWETIASQSASPFRPKGGLLEPVFEVFYEPLGEPLPSLPSPIWLPQPTKPLPEVETEPAVLPIPLPGVSPPLPAAVPDAQPVPSTEPQPLPISIPRRPVVFPFVQPVIEPAETQTTTQAGTVSPKTPAKVATTPKDVHLFGNSGGRVAGSTMRSSTTAVAQEVGRLEQKLSKMNTGFPSTGGLADILRLLLGLNELLNSQKDGTIYELKSVCECPPDDDECEEETTTVETEGGYYVDAILSRLDALPTLLQAQKDYKQPICETNIKPTLLGDFRTLAFISDKKSEFGNDRLRKQFRYRSQSTIDLGELVDHWKDFAWEAGPVCVQHKGAWWGTPQVWASTAEEGKRVIRHAGSEAGLDPDASGEWIVGGSSSARYGQSGTMRICTKGGYYWITERLGSNNRPQVAKT